MVTTGSRVVPVRTCFPRELGEELFPLGFDTHDGAVMLVDGRGRFLLVHHTGNYCLADDALRAVWNFMRAETRDAEDFRA
ncbi:hypothetical protein F0L17_15750 [Streptomyces sp. TRM43335]|uniref:Uncharacterized protein n=1 Tax=Streptomyces taklimakanensis TaxID=2569853 RepID=A0A6G2BEP4_9ACTN|nr:SUKH-3 domain-containing protein [Streptomyces taklimakanensis]MTE20533.1 hypothetical protein [Streptomyces taklimakanensis]